MKESSLEGRLLQYLDERADESDREKKSIKAHLQQEQSNQGPSYRTVYRMDDWRSSQTQGGHDIHFALEQGKMDQLQADRLVCLEEVAKEPASRRLGTYRIRITEKGRKLVANRFSDDTA